MAKADGLNNVEQAIAALYGALETVAGLRIARGVGMRLDPPAALVAPPTLTWDSYALEPTEATFVVPVVVGQTERALSELLAWTPLVVEAISGVQNAAVRSAEPGTWASGGPDLPAYLIRVEVGLL